jgi:hypothetical protein
LLSAPAQSQPITFADLEGYAVAADLHREQQVRQEGRTNTIRIHQTWTYYVNEDRYIVMTLKTTVQTPQGRRTAKPNTGSFTLNEPLKMKSRGGGEAVFTFAGGVLTFIRTYPAGAYRANFAFSRTKTGFACSVTEALAREKGKDVRMESPFGGEITIVSSKSLSSTCTVTKRR